MSDEIGSASELSTEVAHFEIDKAVAEHSLDPAPNQPGLREAYLERRAGSFRGLNLGLVFNEKLNPHKFYKTAEHPFFIQWTNVSADEKDGIGWPETLKSIGPRPEVERLLDILAYCHDQAAGFYPWSHPAEGSYVKSMPEYGMTQPDWLGMGVSYQDLIQPLQKAIKEQDVDHFNQEVTHLTASMVHERAHGEFDEMGFAHPEAISQGMQFLYAPGENPIFENILDFAFKRAESILNHRAKTNAVGTYERGNIVWSVFMYNQMSNLYPEQFPKLSDSAGDNIELMRQMPKLFLETRKSIGEDEWLKLRVI